MRIVTLAIPLLLAASAAPAIAEQGAFGGPKSLIHGNYCGPGNNAPLPPIDALDAACARHDACTPNGGLPDRVCNLRLEREAQAIERDPRQPDDLRALAGLVAVGATLIPTNPAVAVLPTPSAPARAIAPRRPAAVEGVPAEGEDAVDE